MKRTILVLGIIISIFMVMSCLENDDTGFVPTILQTNVSSPYFKGDSIPPEENDSTQLPPDTGGETGQNPVRP